MKTFACAGMLILFSCKSQKNEWTWANAKDGDVSYRNYYAFKKKGLGRFLYRNKFVKRDGIWIKSI